VSHCDYSKANCGVAVVVRVGGHRLHECLAGCVQSVGSLNCDFNKEDATCTLSDDLA
jgi:hypothetical protein